MNKLLLTLTKIVVLAGVAVVAIQFAYRYGQENLETDSHFPSETLPQDVTASSADKSEDEKVILGLTPDEALAAIRKRPEFTISENETLHFTTWAFECETFGLHHAPLAKAHGRVKSANDHGVTSLYLSYTNLGSYDSPYGKSQKEANEHFARRALSLLIDFATVEYTGSKQAIVEDWIRRNIDEKSTHRRFGSALFILESPEPRTRTLQISARGRLKDVER